MTRIAERDLEALRELALRMGGLAEAILSKAVRSVMDRDTALCAEVHQDDLEIDRLDVAIDEAVLKFLALQAPVAKDLRQVIAIKTMATDLERVGDLARNIAGSARRLADRHPVPIPPRLEQLARDSQRLLKRALDCFADTDPEVAREVLLEDDRIDENHDSVIREAIRELGDHPELSSQEVNLILIAKDLERVADHATNIAEDVILISEARNLKHAVKLRP